MHVHMPYGGWAKAGCYLYGVCSGRAQLPRHVQGGNFHASGRDRTRCADVLSGAEQHILGGHRGGHLQVLVLFWQGRGMHPSQQLGCNRPDTADTPCVQHASRLRWARHPVWLRLEQRGLRWHLEDEAAARCGEQRGAAGPAARHIEAER